VIQGGSSDDSYGCKAEKIACLCQALPASILNRLIKAWDALDRQGVVQERRDGDRKASWRLRYRGFDERSQRARHLSIPLGRDPAVVAQVQAVITLLREGRGAGKKAQRREKATKRECLAGVRENLYHCVRGGRRNKARAWRACRQLIANGDPTRAVTFAATLGSQFPPAQLGRPRVNRSW